MHRHRFILFILVLTALLTVWGSGRASAQVLTAKAPHAKVDDTVHIHTALTNLGESDFSIPDDSDLVVTDVVATCRTINDCEMNLNGPTSNAGDDLVVLEVPAGTTVSHAFNTGFRVPGGNSAELIIQNMIQPGPNALLDVAITGYFLRK